MHDTALPHGEVLDGRFLVVRPLAEGGMGTVYEGLQLSVERPVAIKMIRDDLVHDDATVRRFLREARVLTAFNHPRVVQVLDAGQTARGGLYLVMELLSGRTLDQLLAQEGRLAPVRACEIAWQVCDVLVAAEDRGLVHRDLKPANIVVDDALGLVKVLDFGLARSLQPDPETSLITQTGVMLGTPHYMAPEAIGGDLDPRSDLYALGCVLYELVAGVPPFDAPALDVLLRRQLEEPAPELPPDVPEAVRELIAALLEKDPARRPPSALAARDLLDEVLDELAEPPTLIRQPPLRAPSPLPRRARAVSPLVAAALLVALAIATFAIAVLVMT